MCDIYGSDEVSLCGYDVLIRLVEFPIGHQLMVVVEAAACPPHELKDLVLCALHLP